MERPQNYLLVIIALAYIIGAIGYAVSSWRSYFIDLTPYFLLLTSGSVLLYTFSWKKRAVTVVVIIFLATLVAEVIGVNTGYLFGEYDYSSILGWRVWGTPVIISLNWLIIIIGAHSIARQALRQKPTWLIPLVAGILTTLFDFILEPVAISLNYWQWDGGNVPLSNYLTWFGLTVILSAILLCTKVKIKNYAAAILFLIQLLFFAVLNIIIHGLG